MAVAVRTLDPPATRALRWAVLRAGVVPAELDRPLHDDETAGVSCIGILDGTTSEPLCCCLLLPTPLPPALAATVPEGGASWRLRGMATRADRRGRGLGTAVLAEAIRRVGATGGGLLWCHARLAARELYARAGLVVEGPPFEEPGIGPHLLMWRLVEASPSPGG